MTAGGFGEVDHDLLADYVGGALDGTPDEARVARLVDEDAAWAEAYALLAPALASVRADLAAAWAGPAPEMPTDVTDRLVAALANAPAPDTGPLDPTPARSDLVRPEPHDSESARSEVVRSRSGGGDAVPADEPGTSRSGGVVPAQPLGGSARRPAGVPRSEPGRGAATGPGRRRRRWSRLAGPVALAAASIAAVGLGVSQFAGEQGDGAADTALSRPAKPEVAGPAGTPFRAGEPTLRSGRDYTPESLADVSPTMGAQRFSADPRPNVEVEGGRLPGDAVGLGRLADPAALSDCIHEIGAEHGGGPLVVDVVDYARFQGQPALVVRFTDNSGAHWAWVSGPECGVPGSGSDSRYRTRVG
ncbi:hypothetical protein ACGF5C_13470 [Micromonospora sp. NPDC047620]|uniref:hypothetical protein n=1 Tax=Micromonospora sp. NPDC047620 TaxID=3364251 RepID=UPI00371AF4F7